MAYKDLLLYLNSYPEVTPAAPIEQVVSFAGLLGARLSALTFEIDSLEIVGNEARAIVRQHLDRMALRPDGKVHHVETWATQREIWLRTPAGWKLRRVDGVRDQRRLVDGKEE